MSAVNNLDENAVTNSERLIFIKNLGYTVTNNEPNTKSVNIPEKFYDVYQNYNLLQQKAGYDLSLYKGCEVVIYTYNINPPVKYTGEWAINLIVYNNRIIGGDVSASAFGGHMLPLKKQSE